MSFFNSFLNPAPYHVLCYGTLLGSSVWHSFVGGIIQFKTLSRPQFSQLQQQQFPVYFGIQTIFPALLLLTYPGPAKALGSSISSYAALQPANRLGAGFLAAAGICGLANWAGLGPTTTKVMRKRKHQETKDGKKYYDAGPHSEDMKNLNKQFGMLHGLSSLVNLIEIISLVGYGIVLSRRLH